VVQSYLAALDDWRRASPHQEAVVDHNVASMRRTGVVERRSVTSVDSLWEQVISVAAALRQRGVAAGDVVAIQLPTWNENYTATIAVHAIGALPMQISPVYRTRDVDRQIRLASATALIVPSSFGSFDYVDMAVQLKAGTPTLKLLIAVGQAAPNVDGVVSWDAIQVEGRSEALAEDRAAIAAHRFAPALDQPTLLNFSSGTTGEPKGIVHSTQSIEASCAAIIERMELDNRERFLIPVTLGHAAGYLNGLFMPLLSRATVVYMDLWDADLALSVIERERTTYGPMMPTHLFDLVGNPRFGTADISSWTKARVSGGPVGRDIVASVHEGHPTLRLCPGWGFTEALYLTGSSPNDDVQVRNRTEGRPLSNCTLQIRDSSFTHELPAGQVGEIVVKAGSLMLGYYNRTELTRSSFTADGWFKSGDLGSIDENGILTVQGRSKDLIVRGGENVPAVEIEHLLLRHAKVKAVAIIGLPDPRLGERVCAVVECKSYSDQLQFEEMKAFLIECKLTRQFIPEKLVILESLPLTISDKIKKKELQERVRAMVAHA